ncbi:hypothetical protein Ahy_A07g036458 isoform A [Arachis hypogaea]|uniref:Uncharacterized protein n=1 Tax=Arachis hypogaea TaxID=3818 RepID=A0A445CG94_ARAHY|nr:hypothetical protein Ahy_A07g036458 isoform A [Arachis hypogaea]
MEVLLGGGEWRTGVAASCDDGELETQTLYLSALMVVSHGQKVSLGNYKLLEINEPERGERERSTKHNKARARGKVADDDTGIDGWGNCQQHHGRAQRKEKTWITPFTLPLHAGATRRREEISDGEERRHGCGDLLEMQHLEFLEGGWVKVPYFPSKEVILKKAQIIMNPGLLGKRLVRS